jgi:hypothetical protein
MAESKEARNKALVLKAFDTLFNKRDYAAAERLWSPNYIQHSAHIEPGPEGLINLIKSLPPTLKYEAGTIARVGCANLWLGKKVSRGLFRTVPRRGTWRGLEGSSSAGPLRFASVGLRLHLKPRSPGQ